MDDATIQRYQPGGDIYATLVNQYGAANANGIAAAARTGDRSAVSDAIERARGNPDPGSTSTLVNFVDQITTNPFAAPLESANKVIKNSLFSAFKNPLATIAILAVIAIVLFFLFGGSNAIRRKVSAL